MALRRYRRRALRAFTAGHVLCAALFALAAPLRAEDRRGPGAPAAERAAELGLVIALRAESGNYRSFQQFEPTTGESRSYEARVYGGVGLSIGYERPLAEGLLSWALGADYWRSLLFESGARRLGRAVETTAQRLNAGAGLWLHPFAAPDSASFGLFAGVGGMRFDFDMPAGAEAMELATGNYDYVSPGLSVRVPLRPLELRLRGGYLLVLHTGAFGSRKVEGQPDGLDALAAVDYRVLPWLDLSLRGGVTLFVFELAPLSARPTDAPARVEDLYVTLGLAAQAHL